MLCLVLSFRAQHWPPPNLHAVQAEAWLHGRTDVDRNLHDVSWHETRAYVPFPPFPSVLVLPLVAVYGVERAPIRALAVCLTLVAAWALLRMLRHLDLAPEPRRWLAGGFFLGTGYWHCVLWSGGVWFLAHLVAVTFLLLALAEALRGGRPVLVGLLVGLAFLSRHLAVYTLPFLGVVVWSSSLGLPRTQRVQHVLSLLTGFAVCAGIYLAYNHVRFGSPWDTGYGGFPLGDHLKPRFERYGLFHPAYIPFNFIHLFVEGLHVEFGAERLLTPLHAHDMGTSLTVASPFVFAALWAGREGLNVKVAWICVAAALAQQLLYYNNGWVQLNTQRFTLDFLPLLTVLVALGMKRLHPHVWKTAIVWAVGLNAFVLAGIPLLGRLLRGL